VGDFLRFLLRLLQFFLICLPLFLNPFHFQIFGVIGVFGLRGSALRTTLCGLLGHLSGAPSHGHLLGFSLSLFMDFSLLLNHLNLCFDVLPDYLASLALNSSIVRFVRLVNDLGDVSDNILDVFGVHVDVVLQLFELL